jgi:hypothetical protein
MDILAMASMKARAAWNLATLSTLWGLDPLRAHARLGWLRHHGYVNMRGYWWSLTPAGGEALERELSAIASEAASEVDDRLSEAKRFFAQGQTT